MKRSMKGFRSQMNSKRSSHLFWSQELSSFLKKCKHIFLLNKVEGLTYAETAQELGISVKTVERHMGIALKKLRAYMCQAGDVKIN